MGAKKKPPAAGAFSLTYLQFFLRWMELCVKL
jgi:hypothetical protein